MSQPSTQNNAEGKTSLSGKILKSDNFIYTFLRSGVSSQASGWADMATSFVLFAWLHLTPFLSSALGAVVGGVVNCVLNYKFTFHASGCPWRAVIVKYALVWAGSLLLNSFGTQALYYLLQNWTWLETLGFRPDGYFMAARLTISLLVSWFWNFVLQRYFVYRPTSFDPYAVRFVSALVKPIHHKK